MIVATLLSGGSLTSLLRRNTAPEIPITNTTGAGNTQTTETPTTETPTTETPGTSGTATSTNAGAAEGTSAQGEGLDVFVPGTPDATGTEAQEGATTPGNAAGQAADTAPEQAAAGTTTPTGAANVNAPLPESVINGGFRVAAGAVDSRDGALAAAQTFRDAGYTVTVEPQDNLYLLWIGPYASDAGAERVASRLQQDGLVPDALVYTYDPSEATAEADNAGAGNAGAAGAANNAATGAAGANANAGNATATTPADSANAGNAATTPETTAAPAAETADLTPPAGQQFLQVGAYLSDESAEPQREQLEGLGLTVTSDEDDDGMVRLYVGPFAGAQLAQTQNRLSSQGIDSFPVTP